MKKITLLLMLIAIGFLGFTQTESNNNKAIDDTLVFFDGQNFYGAATLDTGFHYYNIDMDSLIPNQNNPDTANPKWATNWIFDYSTNSQDFMPGDYGTAYFIKASSWFEGGAGQGNNWFIIGPVTIVDTNGQLSWYNKNNKDYTDAYSVYISTVGHQPYVDIDTANPVFHQDGTVKPTIQDSLLRVWHKETLSLANYAGQDIYVAFNHYMFNGDVCYLDHILITGETNTSINDISLSDNGAQLYQNYPNPFNTTSYISYQLNHRSTVRFEFYDVTGRKIMIMNEGIKTTGKHLVTLRANMFNKGIYYYVLVTDNTSLTKKMIIY